jgi:signal peptidase II
MRPIPVLAIIALDQLTKFLISKFMSLDQSIPVLGGFFRLTLVHNRGAAFGILKNQTPVFIGTSIFAVILIYIDLKKHKSGKPSIYNIALNLILAGALGNLIDRIVFGHVIDFLDFRIWPVFNVADSAITIGALLLGYSILRQGGRQTCTP